MTGINSFNSGDIFIDNKNIRTEKLECQKNIGFVSDNPETITNFTGLEYLNFTANIYQMDLKVAKERIIKLTKDFEIFDNLFQPISSYSRGMKQKICICSALLHNPQNLILDEPLVGLDRYSSFVLKKYIREYAKEGHTVLFSTHVLEVAQNVCDKIGIINKGNIIFLGTLEELQKKNHEMSLENIFLQMTESN